MSEDQGEIDVPLVVDQAAREVHARFRQYVSLHDLQQEAHLWVLSHPGTVAKRQKDTEIPIAAKRLKGDIKRGITEYARRERGESLGFDPSDQALYSKRLVVETLRVVIEGASGYTVSRMDLSETTGTKTVNDATAGRIAQVLDVRSALAELEQEDRQLVWDYYGADIAQDDLAKIYGVSQATISRRLERIVDDLIDALDLPSGPACLPGCIGCRLCSFGDRRPGVHSHASGQNQEIS